MLWIVVIAAVGGLGLAFGLSMMMSKGGEVKKPDGTPYSAEVVERANQAARRQGRWITVASLGVLAGCAIWYANYSSPTAVAKRQALERQQACEDSIMAFVMSQRFVERELKAPGSAQFPTVSQIESRPIGNCRFHIAAYVDAQNSFGAMIRTRYTAEMEYLPGQDKWRATGLQLGN